VDHPHALRQRLVDPLLDERVRLAAADLHQRPGLGGDAVDLVDQLAGELRVAVLVDVLHALTAGGCAGPAPRHRASSAIDPSSIATAFLVDHAQQFERLERLFLVELADREADVDDHVVAERDLRQVRQAGFLAHAAEVDASHPQRSVIADLDHLARDAEAHSIAPCRRRWRLGRAGQARGSHRSLTVADPAVVRRNHPIRMDLEAIAGQAPHEVSRKPLVLEDAARKDDRAEAGSRRDLGHEARGDGGDGFLEAGGQVLGRGAPGEAFENPADRRAWVVDEEPFAVRANAYSSGSTLPRSASSSNSMAAWASYSATSRMPRRAAAASNRRPADEATGELSPRAIWTRTTSTSRGSRRPRKARASSGSSQEDDVSVESNASAPGGNRAPFGTAS
jgi:hypothetical protein